MKIAVLTNAFPPRFIGGGARIAQLQVELLKQAGHEVRVWDAQPKWFSASVFVRLIRHLMDLFPRQDLVQEIVAWRPDVLLTHNLTGAGFATPRFIQSSQIRWIHCLHDVQLFEPSGRLHHDHQITLWQRVWSWLRQRSFGKPDAVMSPTQWLLSLHVQRGFFREVIAKIVPNPTPQNLVSFSIRPNREKTVSFRVLFVGRFDVEKGALELPFIIPEQTETYFIADGLLREQLQQIFPRGHFLGALSSEQAIEWMTEVDVLVVPSQVCENQPTVILEALMTGLPAVAYDIGGIRETLGDGGILIPFGDRTAFQQAILSLQEKTVWEHYSKQALAYSERYAAHHWLEAFEGIVKR